METTSERVAQIDFLQQFIADEPIVKQPKDRKNYNKDEIGAAIIGKLKGKSKRMIEFMASEFETFKEAKTFFSDLFPYMPDDIRFKDVNIGKACEAMELSEEELRKGLSEQSTVTELVCHMNIDQIIARTPSLAITGASTDTKLHLVIVATGETLPLDFSSIEKLYESGRYALEKVSKLEKSKTFIWHPLDKPLGQITMSLVHFFDIKVDLPTIQYVPKAFMKSVPGASREYEAIVGKYLILLGQLADSLNVCPFNAGKVNTDEIIPLVYHHLYQSLNGIAREIRKLVESVDAIQSLYLKTYSDSDIDKLVKLEIEKVQKKLMDDVLFHEQKDFLAKCATYRKMDKKNESFTGDLVAESFMPHQLKRRWAGMGKLDSFIKFRDSIRAKFPDANFDFQNISVIGEAADVVVRVIYNYYTVVLKKKVPQLYLSMKTTARVKHEEIKFVSWPERKNIAQQLCQTMPDDPTSLLLVCNYNPDQLGFDKGTDVTSVELLVKSLIKTKKTSLLLPHTLSESSKFTVSMMSLLDRGYVKIIPHPKGHNDTYTYAECALPFEGGEKNAYGAAAVRARQCLEIVRRNTLRNHFMVFGYHFPDKGPMDKTLFQSFAMSMMIRYDDIKLGKIQDLEEARHTMDLIFEGVPETPLTATQTVFGKLADSYVLASQKKVDNNNIPPIPPTDSDSPLFHKQKRSRQDGSPGDKGEEPGPNP